MQKLARIEIVPDENGGHEVVHHYQAKRKGNAYLEHEEPKRHVFGKDEHGEMLDHVREHLGLKESDTEAEAEEGHEEV